MTMKLQSVCLVLVIAPSVMAFLSSQSPRVTSSSLVLRDDLWGRQPSSGGDDGKKDMSASVPFLPRPKLLDGSLAGDVGFDPFGFSGADKASLLYMREAELKHGRLAMLAVVGWPLAELFDKPLAEAVGLQPALTKAGSSPSILNGGLDKIDLAYWGAVIALAGIVEIENAKVREAKGKAYQPGDCGFDPLGFFNTDKAGQMSLMTKEIKHSRLAMMAILGFVVQEVLYGVPVVKETPFFFTPQFF